MASAQQTADPIQTLADLIERLGGVPLDRIRVRPALGTATIHHLLDVREREGRLCELVEGVLVEKTMGYMDSCLAVILSRILSTFVSQRNLGLVSGADGTMALTTALVRIPDVAFTSWDRLPNRRMPPNPVPHLIPNLAVEVLSRHNTPGEMRVKRHDYFTAGVQLVWEVDPVRRTVAVYTSETAVVTLGVDDTLDGGAVLPGFVLPLRELFAELDRQG